MTGIVMTAGQARTATKDAAVLIVKQSIEEAIRLGEREARVPSKILSDDIVNDLRSLGYSVLPSINSSNGMTLTAIRW